jgi:membrane protease YdiL (CAAX protease family)
LFAGELGIGVLAIVVAPLLGLEFTLVSARGAVGREFALGVAATVPLVPVLLLVRRARFPGVRRMRELLHRLLTPIAGALTPPTVIALAAVAGISEELLFRGVLQAGLVGSIGAPAALAVASLIFGALHALTSTYAIYATILGVYLGALYVWTGSLLPAIVVHALYDAIGLMVVRRDILRS